MPADTLIGRDLTSDTVVRLSLTSRYSGLYIIGKPGRGKSNFLLNLIVQDLYNGHGLCVLDPHGDLTTDILGCIPPKREQDVHLLDLKDTNHLFAFDLFAGVNPEDPESLATGEERIIGIFKKTWGGISWGPRLEDLLGNAAHTFFMNPGTTIVDLSPFLTDPSYRQQLLTRVTNEDVLSFFRNEYDPLSRNAQAGIYTPLMNKVRAFLRNPLLRHIVSQPGATVDFAELMEKQQILLVRLSSKLKEATSLLGAAIVLRIFEAALQRDTVPVHQRLPFCLYADEFKIFATETFGDLLEEVRKYRVATTMAHQRRSQLTSDLQDAVKGAVNIVSFQLMSDDSREMEREYVAKLHLPDTDDLLSWALHHSDPVIQRAVRDILRSLPLVTVRYHDDGEALSIGEKAAFFERRLRQAVREGSRKATPFPPPFSYGTFDLHHGAYARLAEGFAVLRNRLLAPQRIDADELSDLGVGIAAAKLEQDEGKMRQFLVKIPLAMTPDHSLIVKTLFDREGPMPEKWPEALSPAYVAAGLRARRIRERTRQRYSQAASVPAANAPQRLDPAPPPTSPVIRASGVSEPPVPFEVLIEE